MITGGTPILGNHHHKTETFEAQQLGRSWKCSSSVFCFFCFVHTIVYSGADFFPRQTWGLKYYGWLVVWNIFYFSIYWE